MNHNFCTIILTSTRQHWGMVDIDKISISDTLSKSIIIKNSYKLCHIKVIPGEENIATDKKKWFQDKGFEVIETVADWKNDHESHGTGLIEDMAKVYNHGNVLKHKFVLHSENDWVWETKELDEYLYHSFYLLDIYPDLIYHRYSRVDKPNLPEDIGGFCINEVDKLFITNREFSFNPFIGRPRDLKYISNFVLKNKVHPHVEMAYEMAAKYLTNNNNIFSFTHNGIIRHVGGQENKEEYENRLKLI